MGSECVVFVAEERKCVDACIGNTLPLSNRELDKCAKLNKAHLHELLITCRRHNSTIFEVHKLEKDEEIALKWCRWCKSLPLYSIHRVYNYLSVN